MNDSKKNSLILLVFVVLGLIGSLQVKSTLKNNSQKTSMNMTSMELEEKIKKQKIENVDLTSKISEYEKKQDDFLNMYIQNKNDANLIRQKIELDLFRLKAGLVEVKGKGIVLTLNDAPEQMVKDEKKERYLIHDSNIRDILNEVKKAGAQAISLNDERIISTSEQVCAGPTIIINSNRYAVPFVIKAIGAQDNLYKKVGESEIVYLLKSFGIRVAVEINDNITIPKYNNNTKLLVKGLEALGE